VLRLAIDKNLAAFVCGDDLHLVDIEQPAAPSLLAIYKADPENFVLYSSGSIAISGNRVFLGHYSGIDEINIADPSNPRLIKTIFLPTGNPRQIRISPNGQLYYIDLSNYVLQDLD